MCAQFVRAHHHISVLNHSVLCIQNVFLILSSATSFRHMINEVNVVEAEQNVSLSFESLLVKRRFLANFVVSIFLLQQRKAHRN